MKKPERTNGFAVRVLIAAIFFAAVPAFSQSSNAAWSGQVQCQLNDQDQTFVRQETQTWALVGGRPVSPTGIPTYNATWSVTGQGQLQRVQGAQTTNIQWTTNVPPQPTTISIFVRTSDNRLIILPRHTQLRADNATTGVRQVIVNGAAQQPTNISHGVWEWQFPHMEASPTDTTVTGSTQSQADAGDAELLHHYGGLPPSATCQWQFTKGDTGATNSNPTGMGGGSQNSNPQGSNQQNSQSGNSGSPNNSQTCDSSATVQQSFEAMKANIKSSYDTLIQGTTDPTQIASLTQQEQKTLAGLTAQEQHDMQKAAADGCTGAGQAGSAQNQSNPPAGSNPAGGQNTTTGSQQVTPTPGAGSSPQLVNLSISYVGNGSGQVTATPAGASCGANCMQYSAGTTVILTATPNSGSKFMAFGNGGGICGTTNPCSFTITTTAAVTGIFHLGDSSTGSQPQVTPTPGAGSSPQLVNLSISYVGNGSGQVTVTPAGASCGANCMQYPAGTTVVLAATPNSGSKFMAFGNGGGICSTTNPCSFTITSTTAVTGIFHLGDSSATSGPVNLTASSSGNGSGNVAMTPVGTACGANCMQYSPGTTVTVIAVPNSGSTFTSFSGGGCGSTNPCSFSIAAPTTVTATFSPNNSSGSTSSGSSGTGSSPGMQIGTPTHTIASLAMLAGVSPTTNNGQSNVTVTLTGQLTHFATGSTKVSFARSATQPQGSTISALPANAALQGIMAAQTSPPALQTGAVQATTATHLTVPVTMTPATAAGSYDITVTTPISSGTETLTLKNVFTVTNTPALTGVNITPAATKKVGASTPPAPTSATYRVVIAGLMCIKAISSDDAIYAGAVVRQYDRRNNQNTMFTNLNTWVYGDINGLINQRKQAGSRGPAGGIGSGDFVPTGFLPGIRDTQPTPQLNNLMPLTLYEGPLTDGVDALVISPSLWINYGDNPLFTTWNQNQDSFTNSIFTDSHITNQINTQTLGTLVLGPGANVAGSEAQTVVHDAATVILDTILVVPFIELQGGPSHDRPVGLADANPSDPTSSTILPNTTLVLTREIIEKRLGTGSWALMQIDLKDTAHSFTGLIGADRPGEYMMFVQIERTAGSGNNTAPGGGANPAGAGGGAGTAGSANPAGAGGGAGSTGSANPSGAGNP